jgi:transposase
MKSKRTYKSIDVERVSIPKLLSLIAGTIVVAIDVAKEAMVVGFADAVGKTHELVRFSHPRQTMLFIELLVRLRDEGREVQVAMEPTGVYGNSLRFQLRARDFSVFQVDPKRAHDVATVLDGTKSHHDPKSCTLIAFLHAHGISQPWRERTADERRARILLKEHHMYAAPEMALYNELEAMTSASWPELNQQMDHDLRWPLELLARFPGPRAVREAPAVEVKEHLRKVSRGMLSDDQIASVLRTAKSTAGETLEAEEEAFLSKLCRSVLELREKLKEVTARMSAMTELNAELRSVRAVIGPAATLALLALVGSPSSYGSAGALEKACGLNLKERSSGTKRGKLSITKRGPARVRQLLYLAALRLVREDELARAWYQQRSAYKGRVKVKAVVAVMRKLLRAVFHVARGEEFDSAKLFDARRLTAAMDSGGDSASTIPSATI